MLKIRNLIRDLIWTDLHKAYQMKEEWSSSTILADPPNPHNLLKFTYPQTTRTLYEMGCASNHNAFINHVEQSPADVYILQSIKSGQTIYIYTYIFIKCK